MSKIKAIRGMNDVLPESSALWLRVEAICADVFKHYSYRQIRTPIVESTQLFTRSIGTDTDIVAKEMYTFEDRNGDSLTLRPEGTASCVRAGIGHGLFYNQQQRLWYVGQMFRHERPQKGRYRQFYQIGAEAYGWETTDIEAEMLAMTNLIWQRLGLKKVRLEINSLGNSETRANYRKALVDYLSQFKAQLDEDSQRRLVTNPLRVLDSKNAQTQQLLENAPSILDFLSETAAADFAQLQSYLTDLHIPFSINPRLVRGLDYYNNTVFEWVNDDYAAQSTVCAGGRYDGLVEQLGGAATPAFGFALGLERLIQILIEQQAGLVVKSDNPDVFIVSAGELARHQALVLSQKLVEQNMTVVMHCGQGSIKNQFKRADKSQAHLALIIGEDESQAQTLNIKNLRDRSPQQCISQNDAIQYVTNCLESL